MSSPLRWGILGTGNIARQFAGGMKSSRRGKLVAVGSRSPDSANVFAQNYGINSRHDYEGLLCDPSVDAIYLSLPNSLHHEWTIKALKAGKHVLCEKPFALNTAQSQEMFDIAEKTGRIVVEAFMYRSHPYVAAVDAAIQSGAIGQVRHIRTSFCYRTTKIAGNIRFDRALAGGALMDIGCYCINFSRHFAGAEPVKIEASARLHETGVDEITSATLQFPNSLIATFTCGMTVQADNTAAICGTDGYIEIPWPWKPTPGKGGYVIARSTPPRQDQKDASAPPTPPRQEFKVDADQDLYALEADDFAAAVLDGKPPSISRADTLGNMRVIDEICTEIGLHF
jgi:D-xylose 1-dehydrogenase (NADP+, D-xylono-1,5-lactone-forming)